MHYQHAYHAGNFADVFKHAVLVELLDRLNRKPTPWCYVDTHAGAGLYDLHASGARKTGEHEGGIGRLTADAAPALAPYLGVVQQTRSLHGASIYPGSPAVALALARKADQLLLFEQQADIAHGLKHNLKPDADAGIAVAVHASDGYRADALLPPKQKRGLVLVDPPFERTDEFEAMLQFLQRALMRFPNGIYALWYPVKKSFDLNRFLRRVSERVQRPCLDLQFETGAAAEGQMRGCGMLVVNPPYQLDREIVPVLDELRRTLAQGPRPRTQVTWVVRETS